MIRYLLTTMLRETDEKSKFITKSNMREQSYQKPKLRRGRTFFQVCWKKKRKMLNKTPEPKSGSTMLLTCLYMIEIQTKQRWLCNKEWLSHWTARSMQTHRGYSGKVTVYCRDDLQTSLVDCQRWHVSMLRPRQEHRICLEKKKSSSDLFSLLDILVSLSFK